MLGGCLGELSEEFFDLKPRNELVAATNSFYGRFGGGALRALKRGF